MTSAPRRPHRRLAGALALLVVASLVLAAAVSVWFLAAAPFALVGAYAAWVGLTLDELLEALATTDDGARGPAGIH